MSLKETKLKGNWTKDYAYPTFIVDSIDGKEVIYLEKGVVLAVEQLKKKIKERCDYVKDIIECEKDCKNKKEECLLFDFMKWIDEVFGVEGSQQK